MPGSHAIEKPAGKFVMSIAKQVIIICKILLFIHLFCFSTVS